MSNLFRTELAALARLSVPIVTVQVGMMAMGFVDVVMVGQLPEKQAELALAAVGLGNVYNLVTTMAGIGVVSALDPVLSQAIGGGDHDQIAKHLQRGVVLALLLSVPICLAQLPVAPVLQFMEQPEGVRQPATNYVRILIAGTPGFLLFLVLRFCLQSFSAVRAVVATIVVANLLNVFLNWLWVHGNWGFAQMGAEGSAWATLCCRWLLPFSLLLFGRGMLWPHLRHWTKAAVDSKALRRLFVLGAPLGAQMVVEFGAFGGALVFMGWFGHIAQSGHQVAIILASFTFMFPLGVSFATSVRVGYGIGRRDRAGARAAAQGALVLGSAIMACFAVALLTLPETLAAQFTTSVEVRAVASSLLPIAGVFQLVDGLQVVALGILRGLGDTRPALIGNLVGFWGIGIPTGLVLAFPMEMGPEGFWWGMVVGLTAVAIMLLWWVRVRLSGDVRRLEV